MAEDGGVEGNNVTESGGGGGGGNEGGAWGSTTYDDGEGSANWTKDLTPEEYLTMMLGPRQVGEWPSLAGKTFSFCRAKSLFSPLKRGDSSS